MRILTQYLDQKSKIKYRQHILKTLFMVISKTVKQLSFHVEMMEKLGAEMDVKTWQLDKNMKKFNFKLNFLPFPQFIFFRNHIWKALFTDM